MTRSMNRWAVLAGYGLLAACSQLLWLSYAFISSQAHHAMGVSSGAVGDLAAIFPLMYVILALPFGRWLDIRFEQALAVGAILTGAGGVLRLAGPTSFGWALAGQFVIAGGQALGVDSDPKGAARSFLEQGAHIGRSRGRRSAYPGRLVRGPAGAPGRPRASNGGPPRADTQRR